MNIKNVEDIAAEDKPIDAETILTDEQLERGGLVKVEAFMRTRTSAAAARKAKQRGATLVDAIIKAVPSVTSHALVTPTPETATTELERLAAIGRKAEALTGWRHRVLKLMGVL